MAVTLKLARFGEKGAPIYRIVAAEKGKKRDGRFLERVGSYNPNMEPSQVSFNQERLEKWIKAGAQTTESVRRLIQKSHPGLIEKREEHTRSKIQASRKARKLRAKGKK